MQKYDFLVFSLIKCYYTDRTTIVIAHRLTTIQNAHHIYSLENGSVVEDGTHETLMTKGGIYQAMVKRQQVENDSLLNMGQVMEGEQQSICMFILERFDSFFTLYFLAVKRTRLLPDSDTNDVNKVQITIQYDNINHHFV